MGAPPASVLRNVSKTYTVAGQAVHALDGLSLEIEPGDYVSLMGASGSGKSTLLNIMGGIDRPSAGEVYLLGERVDTMREQQLISIRRTKVGYVFQEARLLPSLTALENVMLPTAFYSDGGGDARGRAEALLGKVGLTKRADHLAHQLSGGEAQRVCIARALMNRPAVVLADEPTGNLDHANRIEIVEILEALHRERITVVMVTHDPEVAARARRVITIRDGRVLDVRATA